MEKFLQWLHNLFHPQAAPTGPVDANLQPVKPATPIPMPTANPPAKGYTRLDFTKRALLISQMYEGSDGWANITGNFDGAALTCGALGWTFKWDNQQPLVKAFVAKYGQAAAKAMMPNTWTAYWAAVQMPSDQGMEAVAPWSNGSSHVKQPYQDELRAFWNSSGMVEIQVTWADKDMGIFAEKMMLATQAQFELPKPKFQHFAYWFDQAVENGTGNTIAFAQADTISLADILAWCAKGGGYSSKEIEQNAPLWADADKLPRDLFALFKMAYLRSRMSKYEFQSDVMCRRGALAYGKGWVHGPLRDFTKEFSS